MDRNYRDLIEIFLQYSIRDIKSEIEVPNINFIFGEDGFKLFKSIINDNEYRLHHITDDDLNYLNMRSNDDCLSIRIDNSEEFFSYLTQIVNETKKLFIEYDEYFNDRETTRFLLRRIWLRMGINDVENIYSFLSNQLEFVKNRTFDSKNPVIVGTFEDYNVSMCTKACELWDETTRKMIFTIKNDNDSYELPHVLYDINDEGICYIYGVQNKEGKKSKKIERKLYKLNKNISNPNVPPSKVCALLLFIDELKKKGITKIVIPSMQVLSYQYHEILSRNIKDSYEEVKIRYDNNPQDKYVEEEYNYIKRKYDHLYEKQDRISYLKTEELIYLIYRITEHMDNIEIINDLNIQGDNLSIKI